MSTIETLIEHLATATVAESEQEKSVSFAHRALKLDTAADAKDIVDAITLCRGMKSLDLQGNTIGIPAAEAIAKALESQPLLKNAIWKDMFTGRTVDEIPQALGFLSDAVILSSARLVVLDLSDNAFGPRGLTGIVKLLESASCYTLRELHLNNNGLGIQGAKILSDALCRCVENSRRDGTPLELKVFVCGRNRLENEGALSIAKFFSMAQSLESIELPQNGINPEGIQALSQSFFCNKRLKAINLEDNTLTELGAILIARNLSQLREIEVLNFGDCLLRNGGAQLLERELQDSCPELRHLNLGFNEIRADGGMAIVNAVQRKTQLQSVLLNGNMFGEGGCDRIQQRVAELGLDTVFGTLSEDEGSDNDDDNDDLSSFNKEECEPASGEDSDVSVEFVKEEKSLEILPSVAVSAMFRKRWEASLQGGSPLLSEKLQHYGALSYAPSQGYCLSIPEPNPNNYLRMFSHLCSLIDPGDNDETLALAQHHADHYLSKSVQLCSGDIDAFNNSFLVSLGLLKAEDKRDPLYKDITGALVILQHVVQQPYFPPSTSHLLRFFLSRPLKYVTAQERPLRRLMKLLHRA